MKKQAQASWHFYYQMWRQAVGKHQKPRREAALERKLEAVQRQLEQAQYVIDALESFNMVEWSETPGRADAQPISREHTAMIDALQGELNKALARIAELEAILVSYG